MSEKQINELLEEINVDENGIGFIDCGTGTDYTDNNRYQRIVAAIKQNIELQQSNRTIQAEKTELESTLESLKKRLEHLFTSKTICAYDYIEDNGDYGLNIDEVDSFFKTGNRLLFEYAEKNKVDRVDDFRIEIKKGKAITKKKIIYDPIKEVEPIKVEILISENSGKLNVCPICKNELGKYTAISRKDNKTEICSNCGTLEALEAFNNANKDKANEQN